MQCRLNATFRTTYLSALDGLLVCIFRYTGAPTIPVLNSCHLVQGLSIGIWVSAGISGGHINPAVGVHGVKESQFFLEKFRSPFPWPFSVGSRGEKYPVG